MVSKLPLGLNYILINIARCLLSHFLVILSSCFNRMVLFFNRIVLVFRFFAFYHNFSLSHRAAIFRPAGIVISSSRCIVFVRNIINP